MVLVGTKHFKERCKERQLSKKKIKEAVRNGKDSIKVDKHTKIKIITRTEDDKQYLITAYEEKTGKQKSNKIKQYKGYKLKRNNKRKLQEEWNDEEEKNLIEYYNIH